jgi:hypothetical protein
MATVQEFALANIARVDIETEETTPKTFTLIDMASEANIEAYVSEGEEKELRVKNVIKALNKTEDIVMGYDVTLTSVTMQPEVLALVDGGTWDELTKKYTAPPIGSPVTRTPFSLKVYTEDKDTNGDTKGFVCFSFLHCKGQPVNYNLQDGEFFSEELRAKSRPKMGESPVEITHMEALPA